MSNQKSSIQNKKTISTIIHSLATPIFIKDKSHNWILVNQAFCDFINLTEDELIGKSDYDFFPKEQADIFWEKDNQTFSTRETNVNKEKITTADGDVRHIETKKIVFHDDIYGDVLCGVITDITEIQKYQQQLDQANTELTEKVRKRTKELEFLNQKLKVMAFKDQLTGLMNRNAFDLAAIKAISHAKEQKTKIAFLFLDMDGLKFVNDSYGHPVGDLLIKEAGNRLKNLLSTNGKLARIGGDEFLIMQPYASFNDINELAQLIVQHMQTPVQLNNKTLPLNSSLGIACYPQHGDDWISLFQNADCAMYAAKNKNKGSFEVYQQRFTNETLRKFELENELREAVENNQINIYFQPIMDTETQILCGYEALARWESPTLGAISPEEFIPLAEQSDLITELGSKVMSQALYFIKHRCCENEYVSVNVSSKQLQNPDFESTLTQLISDNQVNPKQLVLEVTENVLTKVSKNLSKVSESMALSGIRVFVDDFGTGYSNLMQLRKLKFSALKVDREFIHDLLSSETDQSLVKAIALMAKEMGLNVIAEGVETEAQRQCLVKLGIQYGQGFYWNKAQSQQYWSELKNSEKKARKNH